MPHLDWPESTAMGKLQRQFYGNRAEATDSSRAVGDDI